jgi:hypothetical protein
MGTTAQCKLNIWDSPGRNFDGVLAFLGDVDGVMVVIDITQAESMSAMG